MRQERSRTKRTPKGDLNLCLIDPIDRVGLCIIAGRREFLSVLFDPLDIDELAHDLQWNAHFETRPSDCQRDAVSGEYTIDIIPPDRDLSKYKLVIAPGLNVITPSEADNLTRYVRQGGHLVLAQRSGMKDEDNSRWPQRQPGPLVSLLGARVEQYMSLTIR
jgi:hypothetical protein